MGLIRGRSKVCGSKNVVTVPMDPKTITCMGEEVFRVSCMNECQVSKATVPATVFAVTERCILSYCPFHALSIQQSPSVGLPGGFCHL